MTGLEAAAPTDRELEVLRAFVVGGSQKAAADELGISLHTVKNHQRNLFDRLGVQGHVQAMVALGWVTIPGARAPGTCGWIGACYRHANHRGQHGGFRPVVLGL